MKILVIGSGAREHALCWRVSQDPGVTAVVCAPGNAGIAREFPTLPLAVTDPAAVVFAAQAERVDLTVIGPEAALATGVADILRERGLPVFGPRRAAAQLETSKAFAKQFMQRHQVPTAPFQVCDTLSAALAVIESGELGDTVVVKADGLAAGKGVVVAETRDEAAAAVRALLDDRILGDAGQRVVLEQRLHGTEVSFFVIADGEHAVSLGTAQDYKRLLDEDRGPNTGGMGALAPSPSVDDALHDRIMRTVVHPVLQGLIREGSPYRGVLYCGLMLTAAGPQVIEFNVRFGDPEAQVLLGTIDEPLTPLLWAAATGVLRSSRVRRSARPRVGVVLASAGYPGLTHTDDVIGGLEHIRDAHVFYAGVAARENELVTSGGRVLTVVSGGDSYRQAAERVYAAVSHVHYAGMHYRRDIGR